MASATINKQKYAFQCSVQEELSQVLIHFCYTFLYFTWTHRKIKISSWGEKWMEQFNLLYDKIYKFVGTMSNNKNNPLCNCTQPPPPLSACITHEWLLTASLLVFESNILLLSLRIHHASHFNEMYTALYAISLLPWSYYPTKVFEWLQTFHLIKQMVRWVPCHHGMARPQVADWEDTLQVSREAANILNKQLRTVEKGWSPSLGIGRGANNS
jgi:hypothetical protein